MNNRRILIIAAHPDDEVLGCGGTIARHVDAGDSVEVIFVADGVTSRPACPQSEIAKRQEAARTALGILGVHRQHQLAFPDNRLDTVPLLDIVQALERLITLIAPEVVYTHHHGDLNVDHRRVHEAVLTACRPQPRNCIREIYSFEVMSSTEWNSSGKQPFIPQMYIDISAQLTRKLEALAAYGDELRQAPHSRSIEHLRSLATHRGHEVGMLAAEAFSAIRLLR